MLKTSQILKVVNSTLKSEFGVPVYGKETKEGYKMPCFHTELLINKMERMNKYIVKMDISVNIAYLMEVVDQVEQFEVIEKMRELFVDTLRVGERVLHINYFNEEYTGEYKDILEFGIDIEYYDNRYKKVVDRPIEDVEMKLKRKEDNSVFN